MTLTKKIHAAVARTEILPFRIEVASKAQMPGILQLRAASYGKHLPELGAKLREPEDADFRKGCEVLVATSKLDGTVLGTLRTHANVIAPLPLQMSVKLPRPFRNQRMVESTRLCIKGNPGSSLVRTALFKAFHQYCLDQQADYMLATGRKPVDRIYDSLLFQDVGQPQHFYPMTFTGGIPHRVMYLAPEKVQTLWAEEQHALTDFFFARVHPDIDLSRARSLASEVWLCPETESAPSTLTLSDTTSTALPLIRSREEGIRSAWSREDSDLAPLN